MNNFTPRAQQVLALARKEADRFNHNYVGTEHLLLGLIKLGQGVAVNVLQKMGLDLETVRMEVEKHVGSHPETKMVGNIPYTPRVKKVLALAGKEAKALNHSYVGTEHILLGLLREGEGVAARVLKSLDIDIERTRNEILRELDPQFSGGETGAAGSEEAAAGGSPRPGAKNIILFIDEMHTIVGAGAAEGAMDASNIFKPALSRGELQCIGATTLNEYRKYIEKDSALDRRFQSVKVEAPSVDDTILILKGIRGKYEEHHKATFTDKSLETAAKLSDRYITGRFLPDKAIDVMDEAGSRSPNTTPNPPPEIQAIGSAI